MNWKIRFQERTGWRLKNDEEQTKNDEERWRISTKSLTEMSQKCYESTSTWIFLTETIFLANFERFLNTRRAEHFCSALFTLFIGEKKGGGCRPARLGEQCCFHQKALPSFRMVAICTPLFTKYTPLCVFLLISFRKVTELYGLRKDTYFLSGMLWNLMDYATILVFLLEYCETLRITQRCLFLRVPKEAKKVQGPTISTPGQN